MKHVKKIITIFAIASVMGTMLVGCSGKSQTTSTSEPPKTEVESTAKPENETNESTEPSTEESTEQSAVDSTEIVAGTEMSSAGNIPFNTTVSGLVESGSTAWYAFTTDDTERGTYKVISENTTSGEETTMEVIVYDEYGTKLAGNSQYVKNDGQIGTVTLEKASANTTYYIGINVAAFYDDCDYNITVKPVKE